MIRPATFVCALLAFGSGLYLYQSKHRAQLLDREIARTVKDTGAANERINILKTEYQLLNEPERLQALASQYLPTKPMAPTQIVATAELGQHLPAPLPASAFAPPADEPVVAAMPTPVVTPPALVASAAPPRPAPRPAPVAVAAAIVAAAATPVPPRPAPDRMAFDHIPGDRYAADRGADRILPRRVPDVLPAPVPASRTGAPIVIGAAVAMPLAPAVPLAPRPALVQRVAANVPSPAAMPAVMPVMSQAMASPIAFPSTPPVVTSALGIATRGSLLPPPVPVH